jgi:proteasome accessory factor A
VISAIDIQERYAEAARSRYYGRDEEMDWVIDEWQRVLADLRGDYEKLVGRLDWASKLWMLESFRAAEGLDWDAPWIKSLDLEYHNLQTDRGLYFALAEEGRVRRYITDDAAELAVAHPRAIPARSAGAKPSSGSWPETGDT